MLRDELSILGAWSVLRRHALCALHVELVDLFAVQAWVAKPGSRSIALPCARVFANVRCSRGLVPMGDEDGLYQSEVCVV